MYERKFRNPAGDRGGTGRKEFLLPGEVVRRLDDENGFFVVKLPGQWFVNWPEEARAEDHGSMWIFRPEKPDKDSHAIKLNIPRAGKDAFITGEGALRLLLELQGARKGSALVFQAKFWPELSEASEVHIFPDNRGLRKVRKKRLG